MCVLVCLESDVILEDGVPLLQHDLVPPGSGLSCNQFLEISDGVVFVALDAHLLTQTIIHSDLNHTETDNQLLQLRSE